MRQKRSGSWYWEYGMNRWIIGKEPRRYVPNIYDYAADGLKRRYPAKIGGLNIAGTSSPTAQQF